MSDETLAPPATIPALGLLTGEADAAILAEQQEAEDIIEAVWQDGALTDREAIAHLAPLLRVAEAAAALTQARVDRIKELLRRVYQHSGEKVISLPEFDLELVTRNAYTRYTADHRVVRSVAGELEELGEPHLVRLAKELRAGIKESEIAGGAVVGRPEKKGKK